MAMVRCVTEMGMGVDVHGLDYTKAATRAVFDAIHHSSLGFQRMLGKTADDMHVAVTIGVSKPDQVDTKAVLATLPHGMATGKAPAWQFKAASRFPASKAMTGCLSPTQSSSSVSTTASNCHRVYRTGQKGETRALRYERGCPRR